MTATLSDVLLATKMANMDCAIIELGKNRVLQLPHLRYAYFHFVLEGMGIVKLFDSKEQRLIEQGDFLLIIRGIGHSLQTQEPNNTIPFDYFRAKHAFDEPPVLCIGNTPELRVLSGIFGMDQSSDGKMDMVIPDIISLKAADGPFGPFFALCGTANTFEAACHGPGAKAFISSFVLLFYVHIMRRNLPRLLSTQTADVRSLRLPQIAAALRLAETQSNRAWTIFKLAQEVGLSRSVFAEKFLASVGESPLRYLRRIRMVKAAELLQRGISVNEAALAVGYHSAPAFARAFRRHFGRAPSKSSAAFE